MKYDIAIIGGGIVGCATALALSRTGKYSLVVIEAESRLAYHQSGNNSGVIHAGLYYKPGSLKAKLCVTGRERLYRFCREYDIPHDNCGKLVVAVSEDQIPQLDSLAERGRANGIEGIIKLDSAGIREHEPHSSGIAGLYVPVTGIVDYIRVVEKYADLIVQGGGEIRTNTRVTNIISENNTIRLVTSQGEIECKNLINCAGLYSDRVARNAGVKPNLQIIPFRGEYYALKPEKRHLVKNLIYPVPDPRFPFLGVHFTRRVDGTIEAGPNAVLAFSREGYSHSQISLLELANMALYGGFWKMARKYWRMGLDEFHRSLDKSSFTKELQKLLPEIAEDDLTTGGAGVRAQALESDGSLVDDFRIVEAENMIHVLNAPSPAATASLTIGEYIADLARTKFESA